MHWWIREFVWQVTNDISFDVEPVGLCRVVHDQAAAERPAAVAREALQVLGHAHAAGRGPRPVDLAAGARAAVLEGEDGVLLREHAPQRRAEAGHRGLDAVDHALSVGGVRCGEDGDLALGSPRPALGGFRRCGAVVMRSGCLACCSAIFVW